MFLVSEIFWGVPLKSLNRHYKTGPSTDHRAKFHAGRPTHFEDLIIIIIDNRGLNTRWCLTPLLLLLPTAAYLGQRGLTPAGLPHTTA